MKRPSSKLTRKLISNFPIGKNEKKAATKLKEREIEKLTKQGNED